MRCELAAVLYVGDYFTDTLHCSAAEHNILKRLLLDTWTRGPSIFDLDLVPDGLSIDEWQKARDAVLPLAMGARLRIAERVARLRAASGHRLRPEDWDVVRGIVFERDGHACVYCGATEDLQGDHVVPLCRGGSNAPDNVVTACAACNLSKGSKTVAEWQADSRLLDARGV